jgi:Zn-dependent peptidase ImmA (M78 family)
LPRQMMDPLDNVESPLAVVAKYQQRPPVDLNAISAELGIRVFVSYLGKDIAGQLMRDKVKGGRSGFSIWINSSDHPNRQRFTHAHELAHFILHRDLIESGVVDDTMYRSSLSSYYEVQANKMAADILMPIRLVKIWRQRNDNYRALADVFAVSSEAMRIRFDSIDRGTVNRPPAL